jgi:hypothetical protein
MGTAPLQQLVIRDVLVIQKLRQVRLINSDSKFDSGQVPVPTAEWTTMKLRRANILEPILSR